VDRVVGSQIIKNNQKIDGFNQKIDGFMPSGK
jgi:hypothetical protein